MRALLRPFRWLFRCSSGVPGTHPAAQAADFTRGCPAEDCAVIAIRIASPGLVDINGWGNLPRVASAKALQAFLNDVAESPTERVQ